MPSVQELLEEAKQKIAAQQALLEKLAAPPWELGTVVDILDESVVIVGVGSQKLYEVPKPKGFKDKELGQIWRLNEAGQLLERSAFSFYGGMGTVNKVEEGRIEVSPENGSGVAVLTKSLVALEKGDLVQLCAGNMVIKSKLKKETNLTFKGETSVDWASVGGLAAAKQQLVENLELPYQHREVYSKFNKQPVKGFLFYGRPGNGKTLLAKAAATSLARTHKAANAATGFIYIKGPELLSKWVGDTESSIRRLFEHAREHKRQHGYPAIIFIDEADSLLGQRGRHTASGMEHTIVPQFLSEMDGLDDSAAIVILATNRADILDAAVCRPGRIDRKVWVGPPTPETAPEVFTIHLKTLPLSQKVEDLAKAATILLYNGKWPLYEVHTKCKKVIKFGLAELASGAMLAGIVEQATAAAIRRHIQGDKSDLGMKDLEEAFKLVYSEHGQSTHDHELESFEEEQGVEIEGVAKVFDAKATATA